MPSTNKTPNLKLNQWLPTDRPTADDFNADNENLESLVLTKTGAADAYAAKGPVQLDLLWTGSAAAGTSLVVANMSDYEAFAVRTSYEASALVGARFSAYCRAFNAHGNTSGSSLTVLSASLSNISTTGCTVEYVARYVVPASSGATTADVTGAVTQIYGVRNYAG